MLQQLPEEGAAETDAIDPPIGSDDLLMSLPGDDDGRLGMEMSEADGDGTASVVELGLGAAEEVEEAGATPPAELQELQAAPVEDEEVQRAEALGLQAAVVVTPLDSEEL